MPLPSRWRLTRQFFVSDQVIEKTRTIDLEKEETSCRNGSKISIQTISIPKPDRQDLYVLITQSEIARV